MPTNKKEGIVFGLIMSYTMTTWMELFNSAHNGGGFASLADAPLGRTVVEIMFLGLIVFAVSNLFGNKAGAAFAARHTHPGTDNPYFCKIMRQAGTVAVMCPTMSLIATMLFQIVLAEKPISPLMILPTFLDTVIRNFPIAFFWNMFVAAPFTGWLFGKIFSEKKVRIPSGVEMD